MDGFCTSMTSKTCQEGIMARELFRTSRLRLLLLSHPLRRLLLPHPAADADDDSSARCDDRRWTVDYHDEGRIVCIIIVVVIIIAAAATDVVVALEIRVGRDTGCHRRCHTLLGPLHGYFYVIPAPGCWTPAMPATIKLVWASWHLRERQFNYKSCIIN